MKLEPRARLGPYEILLPLAEGGMGKLFKARDTRLDRTVAVKVLPAPLVENAEARERFQREARAVSKVSHPRICALYDVGSEEGIDFLVLEYIEGDTLAERLSRGPLPLALALEYGAQLAEGLDAAHRAGIVHRDLKPSNVMVTKAGVKILDFGLAKGLNGSLEKDSAESPTEQRDLTREHAVIGTLQYMAPEQLEGKAVDARTDLFALGAILYEMLSGEKAFRGESAASLIACILKNPPPSLPGRPRSLTRTLERCLAKDPGERWQTAKDLGEELRWLGVGQEESQPPSSRGRRLWIAPALASALAAAVLLGSVLRMESPSPGTATRLAVTIPVGRLNPDGSVPFALSPDGKLLVFVISLNEALQMRALDSFESSSIPETEFARNPFFSPDGKWVGYFRFREQTLYKVSLSGGTPQAICRVVGNPTGTWGPDESIVFDSPESGLYRVSSNGGEPEPLTKPNGARREINHRWPQILPDGRVLFTIFTEEEAQSAVVSPRTGETRILAEGVAGARYVPTGHLVYVRTGELFALTFDPKRGKTGGSPIRLEGGISHAVAGPAGDGGARFAISEAGVLAYAPGGVHLGLNELVWVDRAGRATPVSEDDARYEYPHLSSDGKHIAVSLHSETGNHDVWIFDVERRTRTRLTFEGNNSLPFWTPDGSAVSFESTRGGRNRIYRQSADGGGAAEPLPIEVPGMNLGAWSPDGASFAFHAIGAGTGDDIWIVREGEEPRPILASPFTELAPRFSPDGQFLAYSSNESGEAEIYVRPVPAFDAKYLVSRGGGLGPVWSRDGGEIFYRNFEGNQQMAVSVETENGFRVGTPVLLFEGSYDRRYPGHPGYDVAADGRFLMVRPRKGAEEPNEIRVVLNWFAELRRLAPPEP